MICDKQNNKKYSMAVEESTGIPTHPGKCNHIPDATAAQLRVSTYTII